MDIVIEPPPHIVVDPGQDFIDRGKQIVITWDRGEPGSDAQVFFTIQVAGVYSARAALMAAPLPMKGSGRLTAAASSGQSFVKPLADTTWDITLDGTFANEAVATDPEIAEALYAQVTIAAADGLATWVYFGGGLFTDGQVLRIWQSATPDGQQDRTALIFAGA